MVKNNLLWLLLTVLFLACNGKTEQAKIAESSESTRLDPHSFARPDLAVAKHLDLKLKVDFDQQKLSGVATWTIENPGKASEIIFDTDQLEIQKITVGKEAKAVKYVLDPRDSVLGTALHIPIEASTEQVSIHYSTHQNAAALGWMAPSMTFGKKLPFLFTQGQAILTRSWIPCQDSPGNRVSYTAELEVPTGMMALMSAENPQKPNANGHYSFKMEQPIAPYLIALAVGDIAFKQVSLRTGVYAEPAMLEKVAWEFADMEKMVETAEGLYGPYEWGRFDLIVLPTGFPFGGMENPKLTFATPTVVTGDRSLVSLVAHELAHSWSGNLVTNTTWNDFWLNEGFTVYFERRIMEALYGAEYTEMLAQLEYWELLEELKDFGENNPDTKLKGDFAGRNPDDGVTGIAYQKGYLFLLMLEQLSERSKWDEFLKAWFQSNKFSSKTTEDFMAILKRDYLEKYGLTANIDEWVYGPGLPGNCPKPNSSKLANAEKAAKNAATALPSNKDWTPHEWVHFVRNLPKETNLETLKKLDSAFNFTTSGNAEIRYAWYDTAIRLGYVTEILPNIEDFLVNVGRRRFLMPVYTALKETGHLEEARKIFENAKTGYHAVSRESISELLK